MTEEERTLQLTQGMRFERKPAVTPREKAAYAALESVCGDALDILRRLHLRVWHACEGDYRSLPMDEARAMLEEVRAKVDTALEKCPPKE